MDDFIKKLEEQRAALKADLEALTNAQNEDGEARGLTEDEDADFDVKLGEMRKLDERIAELQDAERRETLAAKHHVETGNAGRVESVNEPNPVYRKDSAENSFFRDLAAVKLNMSGSTAARDRLARSQETRAGDMTSVAGAGGEFAPPLWAVEDFIALARAGRVTADLVNHQALPSGVSSINLPKVASGASAAVQATQNSALSDTAMTTTSVSSSITTIGGKQIVSMQLLQQSGIPFDRVILQDLAKAYAIQVDNQVLYGAGSGGEVNGLVNVASNNAFTTASPAVASVTSANSFYNVVSKAAAAVQTAIYEPADAIIMHPNRWGWIVGSVDTNSRPLVVPAGPQFNGVGNPGAAVAQGFAGTFGGYSVYTDPNISLTANSTSGTTAQDEVYLIRRDQVWLYESPVQTASFDATYADNASILFRILGYMGLIANRYTGAVQSIRGTGLVLTAI